MLRKLRFYSRVHPYRSHLRAFEQLMLILQPHVQIADTPEQAEVMMFYGSPFHVNQWAPEIPNFDSVYRIGHFVWEADCLSSDQQRGLLRVDEVWTPSHYCWRIFHKYHPRVFWMPHVVSAPTVLGPAPDVMRIRQSINDAPGTICFLSIGTDDLRKNYNQMVAAFLRVNAEFPNTRLIIKHDPKPGGPTGTLTDGPVTRIYERVPQSFIEALYNRANVYVSAHHSEGWGFTLSDAMARRVLTIAPAYGGNVEFMSPQNSFLMPATEGPVGKSEESNWFHPDMCWGHVSNDDLYNAMVMAYRMVSERRSDQLLQLAYESVMRFDVDFANRVGHSLLQNVLDTLTSRRTIKR